MEHVLFTDLTANRLRARVNQAPVAYLPLGALKSQQDHLPLGFTGILSQGLFSALAREVGGVVLPVVYFSPELPQSLCMISPECSICRVSLTSFANLVECLIHEVADYGFRIVVAHGYDPSIEALEVHRLAWEQKYGLRILLFSRILPQDMTLTDQPPAAGMEACLMRALCPELVDLAHDPLDGDASSLRRLPGDPLEAAYAEQGERALDLQVGAMASILQKALQELVDR